MALKYSKTEEQIKEAVDYLVKDNHSFIVIDMMNI